MQVAINATAKGNVNAAHIPTPETILSNLQYDQLYPPLFSQPATYIRFSSTVEDCCGCPYNMNEEDDVFLKIFNQKRDPSARCSEDDFEATMNFFEETAEAKQPYAAVDSPPVLAFADMGEAMDAAVEQCVKRFAKDIYEHWKTQRVAAGNRPLGASLKVSNGEPLASCRHFANSPCSLRLARILMTAILGSASVGVRSVKFAKPVAETHKVPRSCGDFVKNLKMLGNWLPWCASGRLPGKKCFLWSDISSCSALRSRI